MDYRNRAYYLIGVNTEDYATTIARLKIIPGLKLSPPYNHFKKQKKQFPIGYDANQIYDGVDVNGTIQYMMSVPIADERYDMALSAWIKQGMLRDCKRITKELLGQ